MLVKSIASLTLGVTLLFGCSKISPPPDVKQSNPFIIDYFTYSPYFAVDAPRENIVDYSPRDLKCLADNIYHEARGEGQRGMRLVADTTLNRVLSSKFPDTVCKVVYQRSQFSWTQYGNRKVVKGKAYDKAKMIAKRALYREQDKAKGSLYFFGHKHVTPKWYYYKTKTLVHRNHTFMK